MQKFLAFIGACIVILCAVAVIIISMPAFAVRIVVEVFRRACIAPFIVLAALAAKLTGDKEFERRIVGAALACIGAKRD